MFSHLKRAHQFRLSFFSENIFLHVFLNIASGVKFFVRNENVYIFHGVEGKFFHNIKESFWLVLGRQAGSSHALEEMRLASTSAHTKQKKNKKERLSVRKERNFPCGTITKKQKFVTFFLSSVRYSALPPMMLFYSSTSTKESTVKWRCTQTSIKSIKCKACVQIFS